MLGKLWYLHGRMDLDRCRVCWCWCYLWLAKWMYNKVCGYKWDRVAPSS
mgnify:CR=1 FL=1